MYSASLVPAALLGIIKDGQLFSLSCLVSLAQSFFLQSLANCFYCFASRAFSKCWAWVRKGISVLGFPGSVNVNRINTGNDTMATISERRWTGKECSGLPLHFLRVCNPLQQIIVVRIILSSSVHEDISLAGVSIR